MNIVNMFNYDFPTSSVLYSRSGRVAINLTSSEYREVNGKTNIDFLTPGGDLYFKKMISAEVSKVLKFHTKCHVTLPPSCSLHYLYIIVGRK